MTQWNDQAPLSRRQARERERQGDGSQPTSAVSAASAAEPETSVGLPFGAPVEDAPQSGSAVESAPAEVAARETDVAHDTGERRGRRASGASVDGSASAPAPASVASAAEPGLRRRDRVRDEQPAPQQPPVASAPAAPAVNSAYTASAAEPGSRRARRVAEQAQVEPQSPKPVDEAAPISDSQWAAVTQLGSAAEPGERPTPSFWSDAPARDVAPQPVPEWAPPVQLPNLPSASATEPRTPEPAPAEPEQTLPRIDLPPVGTPAAAEPERAPEAAPHAPEPEPSAAELPAVRRRGTWQAPAETGEQPASDAEQLRSTAPQPFGRPAAPIASAPGASAPGASAPAEEAVASPAPVEQRPAAETIVPPVGPGVGHWSRQSEAEDDTQSGTGAIGRGMGFATPLNSTNSLVLPSIPEPSNLTGPLGLTGEVLLTGSMELPRSLGSSGADPRRYDTSEVDRLFDQGDYEEVSTDSTPVLAARAISSHSATRGLVATQKPRGSRGFPTALAIGAGVAALVVVGLFVVMVVTGVFSN